MVLGKPTGEPYYIGASASGGWSVNGIRASLDVTLTAEETAALMSLAERVEQRVKAEMEKTNGAA